MGDETGTPQPVDVPDEHDGERPGRNDDLELPIDPADPLKRGDDEPEEEQPGLDPTPPPIAPD